MKKLEFDKYIVMKLPLVQIDGGGVAFYDENDVMYGVGVITKKHFFDTTVSYRVRIKPIDDKFVDRLQYVSELCDWNIEVFDNVEDAQKYAYETNIKCGYIKLNWKDKLKRWLNEKRN